MNAPPPLAEVIGFTAGDLLANRAGRFSDRQRADLEQQVAYYRHTYQRSWGWLDFKTKGWVPWVVWGAMGLQLPLYVALYFVQAPRTGRPDAPLDIALAILVTCLMFAFAFGGAAWLMKRMRPRDELLLRVVEGPLVRRTEEGSGWGADTLVVQVDGVALPVSAAVQQSFVAGARYRLYYADNPSLVLLSAEPAAR